MAVLMKVGANPVKVRPKEERFSLEEMQRLIRGYVEALYMGDRVIYFDEDGRYKRLPINKKASDIVSRYYGNSCVIVGTAVLCHRDESMM